MVSYDAQNDTYYVEAPSDSERGAYYVVEFHPETGRFTCECPSFQFSRDKQCKHIHRYGQEIVDHYNQSRAARPVEPEPEQDEIVLFTITLNSNEPVVGDRAMVKWLLTAIKPGDELVIYRR